MEFERRRHSSPRIDIAPLVDVVFLLLLFFVLTFHFAPDRTLNINLPESETAMNRDQTNLVLSIERSGTLHLNGTPVNLKQLPRELSRMASNTSEQTATIRADRNVPVGLLVKVVDAVKTAGIPSFGIVTSSPETSP